MAGAPAIEPMRALASPPSDEETLTLFTPSTAKIAEIEKSIFEHPFTKSLLNNDKYIASRPHLKIPEQLRGQNLTGGTLLGADKIAVPPLQFSTADGSSFVSIQYLGSALCGHPGIIHGGLLGTLLDEGLARCCFPALPNKVGVTASLNISYKAQLRLIDSPLQVTMWTKRVRAVDFTIGYEVRSVSAPADSRPAVIADTQLAAVHIQEQRLVRLTPEQREYLQSWMR